MDLSDQPPWVLVRSVKRSVAASYSARAARASMEATMMRLLTIFSSVTWAAWANSASVLSFWPISQSKQMLFGASVPDQRGAGFDRGIEVGDGGEDVVVDHDRLGGVAAGFDGLGDDEGDGDADMAHEALGQRRAGGGDLGRAVAVFDLGDAGEVADIVGAEIGAGVDGEHAGQRLGGIRCRC